MTAYTPYPACLTAGSSPLVPPLNLCKLEGGQPPMSPGAPSDAEALTPSQASLSPATFRMQQQQQQQQLHAQHARQASNKVAMLDGAAAQVVAAASAGALVATPNYQPHTIRINPMYDLQITPRIANGATQIAPHMLGLSPQQPPTLTPPQQALPAVPSRQSSGAGYADLQRRPSSDVYQPMGAAAQAAVSGRATDGALAPAAAHGTPQWALPPNPGFYHHPAAPHAVNGVPSSSLWSFPSPGLMFPAAANDAAAYPAAASGAATPYGDPRDVALVPGAALRSRDASPAGDADSRQRIEAALPYLKNALTAGRPPPAPVNGQNAPPRPPRALSPSPAVRVPTPERLAALGAAARCVCVVSSTLVARFTWRSLKNF